MINLANSDITGIKLGNADIVKAYIGSDLVYQKEMWILQETGKVYGPGFSDSEKIIYLKERSHLIAVKQGQEFFVRVKSGDVRLGFSGYLNDDSKEDNSIIIIYKDNKITIKKGYFNFDTKTFKLSYIMKDNIECSYVPYLELSTRDEISSEYEYYILG